MLRILQEHPFRVGVTSSLAMHVVGALIATYILVYEPPPLNLAQFKPMIQAVPVLLERPKPKPPEAKPKPKPALKRAEELPPPAEELPPPPENAEISPSPSYLALVRGMLEANKRYPKRALERGHQGVVVLWFVIDRYGQVVNYRIERSSGSTILDGEVVRLIKKVNKFPMMPDDVARDTLEITMPVRFVLADS